MQENVEYHGQNIFIPIPGKCFLKCIKYFTEIDYTEEFITFIRIENNRSGVMASNRTQQFWKKI